MKMHFFRHFVRRERGIALATSLVFMVVMFIGATALGTIAINNLTLMKISSNSSIALQAAEAGLAEVQERVNSDHGVCPNHAGQTNGWGENGEEWSGNLSNSGATWYVEFWDRTGTPTAAESVNNLHGTNYVTRADGSKVPPKSIDVIIATNVQNPNRNIPKVASIMTNQWTFAIASSGNFSSSGAVVIAGVDTVPNADPATSIALTLAAVADVLADPENNSTYTGIKLAANGTSVELGNGSEMYPDGQIITPLGDSAVDLGGADNIDVQAGSVPIPTLTYSFFTPNPALATTQVLTSLPGTLDGSGGKKNYYIDGNTSVGSLTIVGPDPPAEPLTLSVNGRLTLTGSLNIKNANLYVNGDCTINGGIKDEAGASNCNGSIYVCGANSDLRVNGSSSFSQTNTTGLAIYSQGNVDFNGSQTIQGMVYAAGNVSTNGNCQIVGAVVANGTTSTTVSVGRSTFVFCPLYTQQLTQAARLMKLSWRMIDTAMGIGGYAGQTGQGI